MLSTEEKSLYGTETLTHDAATGDELKGFFKSKGRIDFVFLAFTATACLRLHEGRVAVFQEVLYYEGRRIHA